MMVGFIKKGEEARALVMGERSKALAKKAKYDRDKIARPFYVNRGQNTDVTFVDGKPYRYDPNELGILDNVYYEHQVIPKGGEPGKDTETFVCINEDQAESGKECPLCADGNTRRHMLALTVIDHTEYTDKAGVKHKDEKRLFLATNTTQKLLEVEADVRGTLVGCRYRATRENKDFEPRVGGTYTFLKQLNPDELRSQYGEELVVPLDYDKVLPITEYDDLISMGYGTSILDVSKAQPTEKVDVANEL